MVRVSIAMATYNGAPWLAAQLRSLARQSRLPDELVICDDGSDDATIAVIERFDAPFPVTLHRNPERLGYSGNFTQVIGMCRGDVIFPCDQDDYWHYDKIETVLGKFRPEWMVVVNGLVLADHRMRKIKPLRPSDVMPGCASAVRKTWADTLYPVKGDDTHDHWLTHLSGLLGVLGAIDKPLQLWRRHGENASNHPACGPRQALRPAPIAPIEAWQHEIEIVNGYERFLKRKAEIIEALAPGSLAKALTKLDHKRRAHHRRIELYQQPRLSRAVTVGGMIANGGYRYFNGWKSAANDMVR